ncbi:MAG: hypothetical protein HDS08_03780 [Bacteroides sp.]|nr:hypothetical protein [Bacteroidales bacterium]MBD5243475.1 hypothetical protein [Barnesiella sp.]MBD5315265.1 hypothetical protein [Bacteroides sp.]MDE6249000.1 hypothetical protein [Paramuribaculum sp.]MDE7450176.1 hypothetical protein [Paramuribaculum sp.]
MKLILLTVLMVAIAVILLGIKVLFVKGGKFPSGHAHDIPQLRDKGIGCAHAPEQD